MARDSAPAKGVLSPPEINARGTVVHPFQPWGVFPILGQRWKHAVRRMSAAGENTHINPSIMKTLPLIAIALLSAGSLAHAQSTQSANPQPPPPSQTGTPPGQGEIGKEQLKVSEADLHKEVTDANKASKIIGMEIKNLQNERVGKIKDLVVDTRSGRIAYAVINAGGGLFGGGKLVAVPFESLTPQPGEDHFVMDATKDRLAAAPGFSEDNWPKLDAVGERTIGLSASTDESTKEEARENQDRDRTGTATQRTEPVREPNR